MMWKEFEEIAGYEVSYTTYSTIIEPMYNALPENIDKFQFVKMIDKKAFALPTKAQLKRAMRKEADHLAEICGRYTDYESEQRLEKLAREYAERFYGYDIKSDSNGVWYNIEKEYEFPTLRRGCTYPATLKIMSGMYCMEEVILYA